jgi:endoglucanase
MVHVILFNIFATPVVTQQGALKRSGSGIVGKITGSPVQVAGMSLYWSIWGGEKFYTSDVVTSLANNWNVTLVRASIAVENIGGYLEKPDTQLALVKAVVDAAISNDIYVLVDWHDHNANLHVAEAKDFFSKMAQAYPTTPNIIWEIWNEPDNKNGTGPEGFDSWTDIKTYADTIISEIRKYSSNLVVVGTPKWSSDPESAADNPVVDSNVAYAFHLYAGSHPFYANAQGEEIRSSAEAAMRKGSALFITEFGTTASDGGVNNKTVYKEETTTWLDWADNKRISWANWSLSNIDESSAALIATAPATGIWPDSLLSISGKFIRDRLLARPKTQSTDSALLFTSTIGKGTVTISHDKIVKKGTPVTFTAVPSNGWTFSSWSDGSSSTSNPLTITVADNIALTAQFNPKPGTNMIKEGNFSTTDAWYTWVASGSKAKITFADSQVNFAITKTGPLDWVIQLSQEGIILDSGVEYTVTLDAWSSANRNLSVWVVDMTDPDAAIDVAGDTILLTPTRKNYTVKMTTFCSTKSGVFQILAGGDTLPVFVDNIQMYRSTPSNVIRTPMQKKCNMGYRRSGDCIYWSPSTPQSNVMLLDINGKIIQPASTANPFRLTNLSAGMYLLAFNDGDGRKIFQMIHSFR